MNILEIEKYEKANNGVYSSWKGSPYVSFLFDKKKIYLTYGPHIDSTKQDKDEKKILTYSDLENIDFKLVATKHTEC